MLMSNILGLLLSGVVIIAAPLSSVHVKIFSPPHVYEHQFTTNGQTTVSQNAFLAIGRQVAKFGNTISPFGSSQGVQQFWPAGVFVVPGNDNNYGYKSRIITDRTFDSDNRLDNSDPFLLTGPAAMLAVAYLYGRGGPFFHEIPHEKSLLEKQKDREINGLPGNILGSIRFGHPFCRDCE
ncbi:uncharacterized protein [Chelonus insularis]|uniref:uncharacterized protein isoform X2 n=1 Tax=Chelonus insularis TaxID=460826 RepID=UPI00158AEAE8|nr:uncharacterized protein LOC118071626 isoform X2 [Chelonus insularis]